MLMAENPRITQEEMKLKIGVGIRAIERNVAKLKEKNLLERVGSNKDGYWLLKK
ncbi:MAG: hypothetical protein FWH37_09295 [Candidatus Bathyarchaeota archaeon]|nr:hypothetical protein [Candidatus Termiticorpusculum sp.]